MVTQTRLFRWLSGCLSVHMKFIPNEMIIKSK